MKPRTLAIVAVLSVALVGCNTVLTLRYWFANRSSGTTWEGNLDRVEIPFRMHDNLMIVQLGINGAEPLDFVLDTGAPYPFILDTEAVRSLRLSTSGEIEFAGYPARIAPSLHLTLGGVALTDLTAAVMPQELIPFVDTPQGIVAHGILGYEVFRRFVVDLDYERRLITLIAPESYVHSGATAPIPLVFDERKPYAIFPVTLPDGQRVPAKLHVDTGKTGTLHLDVDSDPRISAPAGGIPTGMWSLKGATRGRIARLPKLQLGELTAKDVVIEYRTYDARGQRADRNGFLGNEILRRYRVIFDYPSERMWIEPTALSDLPYDHDRSGLELADVWSDGYAIESVAPDSPADRAGLGAGDRLVSVAGEGAERFYSHEIRARLRDPAGSAVEVCVESAGARIQCYSLVLEPQL